MKNQHLIFLALGAGVIWYLAKDKEDTDPGTDPGTDSGGSSAKDLTVGKQAFAKRDNTLLKVDPRSNGIVMSSFNDGQLLGIVISIGYENLPTKTNTWLQIKDPFGFQGYYGHYGYVNANDVNLRL